MDTDKPYVDDDDIRFEDLIDDEPPGPAPTSLAELLANGFPANGGMTALAAIAAIAEAPAPGTRLAAVQRGYRQILDKQRRLG